MEGVQVLNHSEIGDVGEGTPGIILSLCTTAMMIVGRYKQHLEYSSACRAPWEQELNVGAEKDGPMARVIVTLLIIFTVVSHPNSLIEE